MEIEVKRMKGWQLSQVATIAVKEIRGYHGASVKEMKKWMKALGKPSKFNPYAQWFVAKLKTTTEIIGFIRWEVYDIDFEKNKVMLMQSWLAIKEKYQGRGIGIKLVKTSLKEVTNYWRRRGREPVMIFVEADEREEKARKFYEKVYEQPDVKILKDVWGPSDGTVFYFKIIRP